MDKDLQALHDKVDFLTEQMLITQRRQQEMLELRQDLTRIGADVFSSAVEELDQVAPYFTTEDLLFLIKKILRNTRSIIALFEQLESANDFIKDVTPLTKDMFQSTLDSLDDLEKRGYFQFVRELFSILDKIVTTFGEDDLKQLGENVVLILTTVKQLTQPEIMQSVQNAVAIYHDIDVQVPEKVSLFSLIKQLGDQDVRRGMATGLQILKKVTDNMEKIDHKQK